MMTQEQIEFFNQLKREEYEENLKNLNEPQETPYTGMLLEEYLYKTYSRALKGLPLKNRNYKAKLDYILN